MGGAVLRCGRFAAAGVLTETTAELALSLTFAAARRVVEADRYMRRGLYLGWAPTLMVGQLLQVWQLPALPACTRSAIGLRTSAPEPQHAVEQCLLSCVMVLHILNKVTRTRREGWVKH